MSAPSSIDPDTPVSDGPEQPTSSPDFPPGGGPVPTPPWGTPPGANAGFFLGPDNATYTNTTIDDFSPLVRFSNIDAGEWINPLTEPSSPGTRPDTERTWLLGTYRRTVVANASIVIDFWGTGISLWGDRGPGYGNFSLSVDGGEPTVHTAFYPAQAAGRAHPLAAIGNLTSGKHNITIVNLETQDDIIGGEGFLIDYAVVTQKVGIPGRLFPKAIDYRRNELVEAVETNGTWTLLSFMDDVPPIDGSAKPDIYIERSAFTTTENFATLTHNFKGTGVQVYGGRNATHGSYRVTLTDTNSTTVLHSAVYNASISCDFPGGESNTPPICDWRGSALKFSAADLNPDVEHELQFQNLADGTRDVFEIDLIRVIDLQDAREPGSLDPTEPGENDGAMHPAAAVNPLVTLIVLLTTLMLVRKTIRD